MSRGNSVIRGVLAPFSMVASEARSMFEVPRAMVGGVVGTAAVCGLLLGLVLWSPSSEASEDDGPTLEFEPGALVRLGPKPEELPEKIVVEEKVGAQARAAVERDEGDEDEHARGHANAESLGETRVEHHILS